MHLLYLPADSPDFNPIEMAFAKLKALLRTASARAIPDQWDAFTRFKHDEAFDPARTVTALNEAFTP